MKSTIAQATKEYMDMKSLLLWLVGVPIPIIILYNIFY